MAGSNDDGRDGSSVTADGPNRRQFLELAGSGAFGAVAARVVYELIGFGTVTGTNLTEQRLGGSPDGISPRFRSTSP